MQRRDLVGTGDCCSSAPRIKLGIVLDRAGYVEAATARGVTAPRLANDWTERGAVVLPSNLEPGEDVIGTRRPGHARPLVERDNTVLKNGVAGGCPVARMLDAGPLRQAPSDF